MQIFGAVLDNPRTVWAACGVIYAINCVFSVYEVGNSLGIRVEPMCGEWAAHG